jgi:predicted ATPase
MLSSSDEAKRFKAFMDRVGKSSGLFQSIDIKLFGTSDDAPFEVDAVLDDKALNLSWLGYGVSQSLPIFVELLDRPKKSWFAIQQPEVHLHPRAQASLGDVFFEMALLDGKRFVIETHSDFTIDRFRMNYRKRRVTWTSYVDRRNCHFHEPSSTTKLLVKLPAPSVHVIPSPFMKLV